MDCWTSIHPWALGNLMTANNDRKRAVPAVPASQSEVSYKRIGFSAIDPVRAPRSPPARWYEKAMVATSAPESSFKGSEKHNE